MKPEVRMRMYIHMSATHIRGPGAYMHQRGLHLLGTAPPMPPPPLVQSLPEPPLFPGCGRRAYVAGGRGLHAPLEQHGDVQPRQGGQRKSTRASKPQDSVHTCARHAHIAMHAANQHRKSDMQYRASIALGTGRLCHVKCLRFAGSETVALDLRTQVSANTSASLSPRSAPWKGSSRRLDHLRTTSRSSACKCFRLSG